MNKQLITDPFIQATSIKRDDILSCEKLKGSYGHASWKFSMEHQTLLFKVNIRNIKNDHLSNEIFATQLLLKKNLNIPQILYSQPVPNPLKYPFYIQTWLPGISAAESLPHLDEKKQKQFARSLGRITAQMHTIKSDYFSHSLYKDQRTQPQSWKNFALNKMEGYSLVIRNEKLLPELFLTSIRKKIIELISYIDGDIVPGFTHMDLHLPNVLVNDMKLSAILDFESACFHDPIWDFVKLDAWIFQLFSNLRKFFLEGYSEIIPWESSFANRLLAYQGIEYLAAFPYFGHRFPDKKMLNNFYQLLEKWLSLTKLEEYE